MNVASLGTPGDDVSMGLERAAAPEATEAPDGRGALCRQCRLCCDGTLFTSVAVTEQESRRLGRRLTVLRSEDGTELQVEQCCVALGPGGCDVYAERPRRCADFKCKLLRRAEAGDISSAEALEIVAEVHEALLRLDRRLPPGKNFYTRVGLLPAASARASRELAAIHVETRSDVEALEALTKHHLYDAADNSSNHAEGVADGM